MQQTGPAIANEFEKAGLAVSNRTNVRVTGNQPLDQSGAASPVRAADEQEPLVIALTHSSLHNSSSSGILFRAGNGWLPYSGVPSRV